MSVDCGLRYGTVYGRSDGKSDENALQRADGIVLCDICCFTGVQYELCIASAYMETGALWSDLCDYFEDSCSLWRQFYPGVCIGNSGYKLFSCGKHAFDGLLCPAVLYYGCGHLRILVTSGFKSDSESAGGERKVMKSRRFIVILFVVFIAFLMLAPTQSVTKVDMANTFAGTSPEHWLGTDNLGRDVFSMVANGCRRTLEVVVIATVVGLLAGTVLGLLAGYYGGLLETIIQFLSDLLLIIPSFIVALVFMGIF